MTDTLKKFFLLAYALTWGLLGPWFLVFNKVYHQKIPSWLWVLAPLAFIGGWGPSLAALIVAARTGGRMAVRKLLGSIAIWRVPVRWYVMTFVLPLLLTAASLVIVDGGFATLRRIDVGTALAGIPMAYLLALPFGPLGEELGWRGFALPRLLPGFGPAKASLIIGGIWTAWHLPMMLWSPGAALPSFVALSLPSVAVYAVEISAVSVWMTVLFLETKGSVLLAICAHLAFNTAETILFGGLPDLGSGQRKSVYLVNVALWALVGLIGLFWLARRSVPALEATQRLGRGGGPSGTKGL